MKIFVSFILILLAWEATSQKPINEVTNLDFRIISGWSNKNKAMEGMAASNPMLQSSGDFSKSKIVLSPTEQAALVNYSKGEYGVMVITQELQIKWNVPVTGRPLAIGKFKNKILVLLTPEYNLVGVNQIDAVLLEPANGRKIISKTILKAPETFFVEAKFFFTTADENFVLGVRHTESVKKVKVSFFGIGYGKMMSQYSNTTKFELINFNDRLEETQRFNIPIKKGLEFINTEMNSNKELFIAYYEEDNTIGIQKIDNSYTNQSGYKTISYELRNKSGFSPDFYVSSYQPDITYVTTAYRNPDKDKVFSIHRINFQDGTVKSNSETIDRAYKKDVKDKHQELNKEMDNPKPSYWEYMDIGELLEYNDKLIVFKEVQITRTATDKPATMTGDGILTVYDKQLNIIDQEIIPKSIQFSGYEGVNSSLHIRNGTLRILSGSARGLMHTIPLIVDYDLNEHRITKYIKADRGNVKTTHFIDPASTLWFEKSFIVLYLVAKGFPIIKSIDSDMLSYTY